MYKYLCSLSRKRAGWCGNLLWCTNAKKNATEEFEERVCYLFFFPLFHSSDLFLNIWLLFSANISFNIQIWSLFITLHKRGRRGYTEVNRLVLLVFNQRMRVRKRKRWKHWLVVPSEKIMNEVRGGSRSGWSMNMPDTQIIMQGRRFSSSASVGTFFFFLELKALSMQRRMVKW